MVRVLSRVFKSLRRNKKQGIPDLGIHSGEWAEVFFI
jgi:hypothetical protein